MNARSNVKWLGLLGLVALLGGSGCAAPSAPEERRSTQARYMTSKCLGTKICDPYGNPNGPGRPQTCEGDGCVATATEEEQPMTQASLLPVMTRPEREEQAPAQAGFLPAAEAAPEGPAAGAYADDGRGWQSSPDFDRGTDEQAELDDWE